jgi:hypothetical protein
VRVAQSGGGPPHSKTLRAVRKPLLNAWRLGVRQSSGAFVRAIIANSLWLHPQERTRQRFDQEVERGTGGVPAIRRNEQSFRRFSFSCNFSMKMETFAHQSRLSKIRQTVNHNQYHENHPSFLHRHPFCRSDRRRKFIGAGAEQL